MVGEFLFNRNFKADLLASTIKGLWTSKDEPPDRHWITASRVGGGNRFLFSFSDESDLKRAIKGSPWSFDKALSIVAVTEGKMDPMEVNVRS